MFRQQYPPPENSTKEEIKPLLKRFGAWLLTMLIRFVSWSGLRLYRFGRYLLHRTDSIHATYNEDALKEVSDLRQGMQNTRGVHAFYSEQFEAKIATYEAERSTYGEVLESKYREQITALQHSLEDLKAQLARQQFEHNHVQSQKDSYSLGVSDLTKQKDELLRKISIHEQSLLFLKTQAEKRLQLIKENADKEIEQAKEEAKRQIKVYHDQEEEISRRADLLSKYRVAERFSSILGTPQGEYNQAREYFELKQKKKNMEKDMENMERDKHKFDLEKMMSTVVNELQGQISELKMQALKDKMEAEIQRITDKSLTSERITKAEAQAEIDKAQNATRFAELGAAVREFGVIIKSNLEVVNERIIGIGASLNAQVSEHRAAVAQHIVRQDENLLRVFEQLREFAKKSDEAETEVQRALLEVEREVSVQAFVVELQGIKDSVEGTAQVMLNEMDTRLVKADSQSKDMVSNAIKLFYAIESKAVEIASLLDAFDAKQKIKKTERETWEEKQRRIEQEIDSKREILQLKSTTEQEKIQATYDIEKLQTSLKWEGYDKRFHKRRAELYKKAWEEKEPESLTDMVERHKREARGDV